MSRTNETMNCDDYKQALAADPHFDGGAEHVAACAKCQAVRDQLLAFDERLAAAMQLAVPELKIPELPDVDTTNVATLVPKSPLTKPMWLALAATVLIAAFVGVRMTSVDDFGTIEEQVLAHLDHEPYATRVTDVAVSAERLARIVPTNVATMNANVGLITYAQGCSINGNSVPHLVIQGERGPVTILLMPEESVAEARNIDGNGIQGVILPVGNGSIAIIGERDEPLEALTQNVLDSVAWST